VNRNPLAELIEFYHSDLFPFDRLISIYAFREINRSVQDCRDGMCIKAVLVIDERQ
jgi:Zn-dependent alcohol dehydrogenase